MSTPEKYPDELVLAVPTGCLYQISGSWRGIRKDSPEIWRVLAKKSCFKPRVLLENDPEYKQLISYTMFLSNRKIFVLKRLNTQSERRLRGLLSVGVGGHMNPVKNIRWPGRRRISDFKTIIQENTLREIREEVALAGNPTINILGFLNDDDNPVGKVHLGIVSVVHLAKPLLAIRENDKMMGMWADIKKLALLGEFETWSYLILKGLI